MIKQVIIFSAGLAVGAAAGILGTRTYFEKKFHKLADEEIDQMREHYQKHRDIVRTEKYESDEPEMRPEREKPKKEKRTQAPRIDYTSYYKPEKEDPAESEHPEDDEAEQMEEFFKKHEGKPPKIISVEAAGELPAGVDHKILRYYTYDDALVEEDTMEEITEPHYFVGDCLDKFDFADSEEQLIFVINYEYSALYEIQKFDSAFWDER